MVEIDKLTLTIKNKVLITSKSSMFSNFFFFHDTIVYFSRGRR
jgi:hypothetical protein